ncbi:hypothetical protein [Haloarchaeobius sp. HRN-SO-5]|uniref:hypothetical protein n=1 Tax=Haloarchaeobius sp. HRN-SO-5 TaxID=3446118 RepID=UPI003EBE0404
MAGKSTARNPGKCNRADIFDSDLEPDVGAADTEDVAHGHIDGEDAGRFRVVTARYSVRTARTYRANRDPSSNHYRDEHRPEMETLDDRTDEAVETVDSTVHDD